MSEENKNYGYNIVMSLKEIQQCQVDAHNITKSNESELLKEIDEKIKNVTDWREKGDLFIQWTKE